MKAITIRRHGGPDVLSLEGVEDPRPGPTEAVIAVHACGVNRLDLDVRAGVSRYKLRFPLILGREAVGVVTETGPDCSWVRPGHRVMVRAHFTCQECGRCRAHEDNFCADALLPGVDVPGGYAELMVAPERSLLPLPPGLSFEEAASVQIAFGTAWHCAVRLAAIEKGETVLVTGAGGGVGTAVVQVAALRGARVIATAGDDEKLERLKALGSTHTVNYAQEALGTAVQALTEGAGADVVIDTAGGPLFEASLAALAPQGRLIVVGAHAGEVVALDLIRVFRTEARIIGSHRSTIEDITEVLALVAAGRLKPVIQATRPLSAAADVHAAIAARTGFGKWVLQPDHASR